MQEIVQLKLREFTEWLIESQYSAPMLLAIDIGNTCIDFGLFKKLDLVQCEKHLLGPPATTGLPRLLAELEKPLAGVVVGSVVADLAGAYLATCNPYCYGPSCEIVGPWDWGLAIDYDDPNRVGVDRLAAAAAAYRFAPEGHAVIVADAGTAITVDAVDTSGTFLGGAIAPGLRIGLDALCAKTSLLPQVEVDAAAPLLGKNTSDGLRAGALHGSTALVEGLYARMAEQLATPTVVFLTGGDSPLLYPHITTKTTYDPALVLRGLALAFQRRTP